MDIVSQLDAISRQLAQRADASGAMVVVTVGRRYPATVSDVWSALTDPERVRRWFLPLTGDLRAGGTYRLEGNASGDILACEPPDHLTITFGGPTSVVDLRLVGEGAETVLAFDHSVPIEMAGSSAGALYVGPGWDEALMALALYLSNEIGDDPVAAADSPDGQAFCAASIEAWTAVVKASSTADAQSVSSARKAAYAQFAPDVKL